MTTPIKQYQNVSFKELISYSENNPNRNRTLDSIEIQSAKSLQETSLDKLGLKGYTAFNLNPSGIVSLYACISDPSSYSLSAKGARLQQIIEYTTKLQEQTDELKNTSLSRKRKKIHDLIGASYNGTKFEDKDYIELFTGISLMRNIYFVLMKSAVQENIEEGEKQYDSSLKGEIVFSSDPTNWKQEYPVWVVDYRARWVAIPSEQHAQDLHKILANWLSTIEQTGWIIQWPEADGTKIEIVEQLSLLPTWQQTDKKLTKDVLGARLGRANCIKVFTKWMTNNIETI
jgi:hypothetical protein|uniref:Uncharacterized protein n=1 Tax=viral metagenome TaxID=1070528 RepID=A0A6C0DVZ8_9ZZZZ